MACDDNFTEDCYDYEPDEAEIVIHVTINDENDSIPYILFKGRIEERDTILVDTATAKKWYVWVPVKEYYSVQAKYTVNGNQVITSDGKKLRLMNDSDDSSVCWKTIGEDHHVQLIYEDEMN